MSSQKQKRMLSNKLIILLYAVFVSIVLYGCADRHFLQLERKITNDLKFNKAKTVVVDLELDKIDFYERRISLHSNRVIKKGILQGKEATFISKKSKKRVQILLRLVSQLITAEIPASDIGQKKIREVLQP